MKANTAKVEQAARAAGIAAELVASFEAHEGRHRRMTEAQYKALRRERERMNRAASRAADRFTLLSGVDYAPGIA